MRKRRDRPGGNTDSHIRRRRRSDLQSYAQDCLQIPTDNEVGRHIDVWGVNRGRYRLIEICGRLKTSRLRDGQVRYTSRQRIEGSGSPAVIARVLDRGRDRANVRVGAYHSDIHCLTGPQPLLL